MTIGDPSILGYGPNRLYKQANAVADGSGNVTIKFDVIPSAEVWTGTVFLSAPLNTVATFTVFADSQYRGGFSAAGSLNGLQAGDGAAVTVNGASLPAAAQVTMVWIGRRDPIDHAPIAVPWTSGPTGIQIVASTTAFPVNVQQAPLPANVLSAEVDSDQGTGINTLVAGIAGSRIRVWSVTLSAAMAELAATAGVKSWSPDIEPHGGTPILKVPMRTVPGSASENSVSQNCYGLTLPSNTSLDLNSPANTADGSRVVGTVLYDVITP